MNWLYIGLPLAALYLLWFAYLLSRRKYTRTLLYFALAHLPYLFVNLVAPFRGILDPNYAGYQLGWIHLPQGPLVPLVVGFIVVASFILASSALLNRMDKLWKFAFGVDLMLLLLIGLPLLLDILKDTSASTIELGEYLSISGIWVAAIIFVLFSGPTFYACYVAGKAVFQQAKIQNASPS